MRNISRKREKVKLEPPMTPMIDIIFQLLIFFLLTPTFQAHEGYLTTNLPKTSGPVEGEEQKKIERIKIGLEDTYGPDEIVIVLNDTQVLGNNFDTLEAMLRDYQGRGIAPDHPVLIAPQMSVKHKWVVKAFDAAILARFTNIHFAVPR